MKEMLMRIKRGNHQTQMWDLFHPRPRTPKWDDLSVPMQRQLIELLASLLREQRDRKAHPAGDKEVDHE
jgi:hypothetical protein